MPSIVTLPVEESLHVSALLLLYFRGSSSVGGKVFLKKFDVFTFSCTVFLFPLVLMLCDCMSQRLADTL